MRHWLCASLLLTSSAYAFDMGDIKVTSGFNEPLRATIPIELTPGTIVEDYILSIKGLPADMPAVHVGIDPNQPDVIKLTSSEPISHNYIQFDVFARSHEETASQAFVITFSKKPAPQGPKPLVYGPVKGGETLWNVAKVFSEHYKMPLDEAMDKLYKSNPKAFVHGKRDSLMAGSYLRLPSQAKAAPVSKPSKLASQKIAAKKPSVAPKPKDVQAIITQEVADALPALPDIQEEGKAVAVNLDKVSGSLELLNPTDTLHSILGKDDQAFVGLLDKIQSELSLSREAIDTERRAKEALQIQLDDMQLQLKALTELIHLKDEEMRAMLTEGTVIKQAAGAAPTASSSMSWNILPADTAKLFSAAANNQMVLLAMAIAVASFMVYLWDHLAMRRAMVQVTPALQAAASKPATVKTQSLQPSPFLLQDIDVYVSHGRYSQAEDMLEQAIAHNPNDFDLLYKLFQVYVKSDNRFAYENKIKRISTRWKQKFPARWQRVQDLYDRAWPMGFEGHGSGGSMGDEAYEGDPPSDPVQTKLDLARAYIDIGNHENAVEILMEVVNEGNEAQVLAAQMLLSNIKH